MNVWLNFAVEVYLYKGVLKMNRALCFINVLVSLLLMGGNANAEGIDHKVEKKRIYFASFPRSGNTWVRNLVENASGISSFSVYRSKSARVDREFGFFGGIDTANHCRLPFDSEAVLIKTHWPALRMRNYDLRPAHFTILIVRNPIDTIYSFYKLNSRYKGLFDRIPKSVLKRYVRRWKNF